MGCRSNIINNRVGWLDGTYCSIVPLWYFSSGSLEQSCRATVIRGSTSGKAQKLAEIKTALT